MFPLAYVIVIICNIQKSYNFMGTWKCVSLKCPYYAYLQAPNFILKVY